MPVEELGTKRHPCGVLVLQEGKKPAELPCRALFGVVFFFFFFEGCEHTVIEGAARTGNEWDPSP